MNYFSYKLAFLCLLTVMLAILLLLTGPVSISLGDLINLKAFPDYQTIFWDIRFPKMLTALLAGWALGLAGLVMQSYFNNPLADPYILGVQSGASLGVAVGIMAFDSLLIFIPGLMGQLSTIFFAIVGSLITLVLLMVLSRKLSNKLILLVMGLVFGHVISGIISILITISESHKIKNFLMWTMGSFQRVSIDQLGIFCAVILFGIIIIFSLSSKLNLLLLGDKYAKSSGMDVLLWRKIFLFWTAVLSGTVTSFCGPIAFVGIISPHLARVFLKTSNHFFLIPSVALVGSLMTLGCELIGGFMGDITLPINAILGLIGGPIVFIILVRYKRIYYS